MEVNWERELGTSELGRTSPRHARLLVRVAASLALQVPPPRHVPTFGDTIQRDNLCATHVVPTL